MEDLSSEIEKVRVPVPEGLPSELMFEYLANCRNSLHSLKDALERRDYEYLRVFGHRMKGCGGAYGFSELTEMGFRIERSAVHRNDRELLDHTRALEEYLTRVEIIAG
jgi:Hpt domain